MQQHSAVIQMASGLISQVVPFCHFSREAQRIGKGLCNYSLSLSSFLPSPPLLVKQIKSGPEEDDWRTPNYIFIYF